MSMAERCISTVTLCPYHSSPPLCRDVIELIYRVIERQQLWAMNGLENLVGEVA